MAAGKRRDPSPMAFLEAQSCCGREDDIFITGRGEEHPQLFFQKVVNRRQIAALRGRVEDAGEGISGAPDGGGVPVEPGAVFRDLPTGLFRLQGHSGGSSHEKGIFARRRLLGHGDRFSGYHAQIFLQFRSGESNHPVGVFSHHDHRLFRIHFHGGSREDR